MLAASPYASPLPGWCPVPLAPTIPDASMMPATTTGSVARYPRLGRSRSSAHAKTATNGTYRLPMTVDNPAPASMIVWLNRTRSTARSRSARNAQTRLARGRCPDRRDHRLLRSRSAPAAQDESASASALAPTCGRARSTIRHRRPRTRCGPWPAAGRPCRLRSMTWTPISPLWSTLSLRNWSPCPAWG